MAKTIKTGNLPVIGEREKVFVKTLKLTVGREDLEGKTLEQIIGIVEEMVRPALNTFIAQCKNKADQWAAETEREKSFRGHEH